MEGTFSNEIHTQNKDHNLANALDQGQRMEYENQVVQQEKDVEPSISQDAAEYYDSTIPESQLMTQDAFEYLDGLGEGNSLALEPDPIDLERDSEDMEINNDMEDLYHELSHDDSIESPVIEQTLDIDGVGEQLDLNDPVQREEYTKQVQEKAIQEFTDSQRQQELERQQLKQEIIDEHIQAQEEKERELEQKLQEREMHDPTADGIKESNKSRAHATKVTAGEKAGAAVGNFVGSVFGGSFSKIKNTFTKGELSQSHVNDWKEKYKSREFDRLQADIDEHLSSLESLSNTDWAVNQSKFDLKVNPQLSDIAQSTAETDKNKRDFIISMADIERLEKCIEKRVHQFSEFMEDKDAGEQLNEMIDSWSEKVEEYLSNIPDVEEKQSLLSNFQESMEKMMENIRNLFKSQMSQTP